MGNHISPGFSSVYNRNILASIFQDETLSFVCAANRQQRG